MSRVDFNDALNDCIERLNAGASLEDCLRRYPEHAAALEVLLETGGLVRRAARSSSQEAIQAREHNRLDFERALRTPHRSTPAYRRLLGFAASVVLICVFLFGGAGLLAQNSLPGDALYPVKLLTETIRLDLSNQNPALEAQFAQRRIDEAQQIVELKREAELHFSGSVNSVSDHALVVAGLAVQSNSARDFAVGSQVEVRAISTEDGLLIAQEIRLLQAPAAPEIPPTLEATATGTATATPTQTRRPSATPTLTLTPTMRPSATAEISATPDCSSGPEGWLRYTVQSGDTASELAADTELTLDELIARNCIADARSIIVGQTIFLPRLPQRSTVDQADTTPQLRPTETETETQEDVRQEDRQQDRNRGSDDNGGSGSDSSGRGR